MNKPSFKFDDQGKFVPPTKEEQLKADESAAIVVLSKGTQANGAPYWAYMAIPPSKYQEFHRLSKERQAFNLEEYGEVIICGCDKEPPAAAKEQMKAEYDFDEEFSKKLEARMLEESKNHIEKVEDKRIMDIVSMLKKAKPAGSA